ncbi:hypothetical protein HMPREF0219_2899 [Clostridioides difficile NAP07]|nr:hypothetical protein HMPREF0219_2899 [Clostridioides difficile NAP07]
MIKIIKLYNQFNNILFSINILLITFIFLLKCIIIKSKSIFDTVLTIIIFRKVILLNILRIIRDGGTKL